MFIMMFELKFQIFFVCGTGWFLFYKNFNLLNEQLKSTKKQILSFNHNNIMAQSNLSKAQEEKLAVLMSMTSANADVAKAFLEVSMAFH